MTARSQNGWTVIAEDQTRRWAVGGRELPLRKGAAGFVLAHWAWYFANNIEPLLPSFDDWGWSPRRISGSTTWSNHASGTAVDLNSDRHPRGVTGTFSQDDTDRIHHRLEGRYESLVRWGGDFTTTPDEMHYEIVGTVAQIQDLAGVLRETPIGQALIEANRD